MAERCGGDLHDGIGRAESPRSGPMGVEIEREHGVGEQLAPPGVADGRSVLIERVGELVGEGGPGDYVAVDSTAHGPA
jgi:hypothetical protein